MAAIALAISLVVGGCADPSPPDTPNFDEATYSDFLEAFNSGSDCPKLYRIRNNMDPDDPNAESVNEALRSVGCFSSSSSRTDN